MDSLQLKLGCSLILIGLLFSPHAWSAPVLNLGIGVDAMYFDYREFDDNDILLNKEEGLLPGLVLSATLDWENWYSELNYQYNRGTVEYDGQTQSGIPIITDTDEDIIVVNLLLGRYFGGAAAYRSAIYAGLGYYYWERNILSTGSVSGLFETYEWSYALLGGKFSLLKSSNNGLLLDVRLRRMLNATMQVDFLGYQNYDNLELDIGEEWSLRVALPYFMTIDQHARFSIEPYLTTWFIGRSPDEQITSGGVPIGISAYEPRSETTNVGISFKYLYSF
mgnify:FL=1